MKKNESTPRILIPPSSQPVQRPTPPRQSVSEPPKPPAAPTAKKRNWKEKFHDAAMPIAGITAAIVASSTNAGAVQVPAVQAATHPASSTDLGTLGQHPRVSKPDLERFIRSSDLLDAVAEAASDRPIENVPTPIHTGGRETGRDWIHQLGEFLKDDAGEIAKHLLNKPIEELITDSIILRYAPRAIKKLYSKESGKEEQTGYTPYTSGFSQSLVGFPALPVYPQYGSLLKLNQKPAPPQESGGQAACSASPDSETHVATPEPGLPVERIGALEEENRSLRAQIAELQNANQAKPKSPAGGTGQD